VPITDIKVYHKDLIVTTQGRAFWILDNVSALHQITPQIATTAAHLFMPRDGYRTRVSPQILGPQIEYYLPSAPSGAVTLEILDAAGAVVNSYNSETPAGGGRGRGGRGGGRGAAPAAAGQAAGADQPPAPVTTSMEEADPEAGGGGRGRGNAPPPRVTKDAGMNRVVWDVRNSSGLAMPPGRYQARLKAGDVTETQPFTVLIDPRIASGGVTTADLTEQFDHNVRMRELSSDVGQLLARARAALNNADAAKASAARAIYEQIVSTPEGVRYNKPGLQSHVQYLASMTTGVDQKIGRDAIERYQVLKKELSALKARADAAGL
jgi:hypothetical protein